MTHDHQERNHKPAKIKMIELKGITWNHPRGYKPLRAVSDEFSMQYPDIKINWKVRSLKEFGDMPIEDLIEHYDIITIDHPYMGQAHANSLLIPLQDKLEKKFLEEQIKHSVGPSFQSYFYKDQLYALPVDAAAQVACYRKDLSKSANFKVPETKKELREIYLNISSQYSVAWPLCPTDLWCSFLTLCAQDGGRNFINNDSLDENIGIQVLEEIKFYLQFLHPDSLYMNPIQVLDRMSNENEILYAPYLFGYTNYARDGYAKFLVDFCNSPVNPSHNVSTLLGGVGLAVSSPSKFVDESIQFIKYACRNSTQIDTYTKNDGQPANLAAWQNDTNNILCHNFFKNTLKTMEDAFVRPQHPGWNEFQEHGADILHLGFIKKNNSKKMIKELNQLYKSIVNYA
jgi:multiple sugar transport system substrate-binding protein